FLCSVLSFVFLYLLSFSFLFFFSSRRRHTRSKRDWSSDVCSSDLSPYEELQKGALVILHKVSRVHNCFFLKFKNVPNFGSCIFRSEERRVGKECRCRWSRDY